MKPLLSPAAAAELIPDDATIMIGGLRSHSGAPADFSNVSTMRV
jgi:hypothetical protein